MTLLTLSLLEIILGIDNLVFIAILVARVDPEKQGFARRVGMSLAMLTRIGLLCTMSYLASLTTPIADWLAVPNGHDKQTHEMIWHHISWRDLVLIAGGTFLLYKSTKEIHEKLEEDEEEIKAPKGRSLPKIILQIVLIDIIFSLDSVITAVGIAKELPIMVAAVVLAMIVMISFSGPISDYINRHPSIKMLALSFLILIGCMLILEGTGREIEKGYVYFAMFFSLGVEWLNMRTRSNKKQRKLKRANNVPIEVA